MLIWPHFCNYPALYQTLRSKLLYEDNAVGVKLADKAKFSVGNKKDTLKKSGYIGDDTIVYSTDAPIVADLL